jgi:uncharacterized membrane protein
MVRALDWAAMTASGVFVLAFAIGAIAGLRSMMAPATVAWGGHLGWLHLQGSRLAFVGSKAAVGILAVLAVVELILDTNPELPNRTAPPSLIVRIITGGFSGAAVCVSAGQSTLGGAALGALGAVIAAFEGYDVRHRIVTNLHVPDLVVAILEDLLAISGGLLIVSRG